MLSSVPALRTLQGSLSFTFPACAPENGIDLDGFFDLEEQVKRLTVICAGYMAVELAGEGGRTYGYGGDGGALKM